MEDTSFANEETGERILRWLVGYLSAAVIIAMIGWFIYFWHLAKTYFER